MAETEDEAAPPRHTVNPDGSVTWPLSEPVTSEGAELTAVTLRRIKPSDMIAIEQIKGDTSRTVALLARLANVPQATIKSLDGFDFAGLNDIAADFMKRPRATGASSS